MHEATFNLHVMSQPTLFINLDFVLLSKVSQYNSLIFLHFESDSLSTMKSKSVVCKDYADNPNLERAEFFYSVPFYLNSGDKSFSIILFAIDEMGCNSYVASSDPIGVYSVCFSLFLVIIFRNLLWLLILLTNQEMLKLVSIYL